MSPRLRLFSAALLCTALVAACSDNGTDNGNPGTIALSLNPTSGSAAQGGQVIVAATLTRGGDFTGTVNLTVTGAPTGVTATLSNIVTTGTTTTATVTVDIAATTAPGVYSLVVHGTGTGVTEATAPYQLTVTAAPVPSYTLALSAPALTIVQGASTPTTTVTIGRSNFTGNIALSVDNLPAGVTAAFAPANPQTGNSSVLTLTVAAGAATGTFTNLLVRGTATGLTDVTAPLSLTIAAPASSFSLSLSAPTLTIPQGGSTPTTTVTITRVNFTGDVTLSVLNLPTGVTAAFAPANPQQGTSSVLTLTVAPTAATGTFNTLAVQGVGSTGTVSTPLTLTISAAAPVGDFTLTTTPATSTTVTQGAGGNVTVNINRTGGNTSAVTLSSTGTLPTGMTLGFAPNGTTAASSVLTITTTGATPLGATPIVIHGNATGLGEQLANLTINVTAPSGSGNVTADFSACDPNDQPAWLAFMDGTAGTWSQVTGVANVYHFTVNQSKGSVAYVTLGGGTSIFVQHLTQAELTAGVLHFCSPDLPAGTLLSGTVSNLGIGFTGRISFGGRGATVAANGPFQIVDEPAGTFDLIGYMKQVLLSGGERVFVKRNETPVGGNFPTTVDFQDATLSKPAVVGAATLSGLVGGETSLTHSMTYYTGGAACNAATLYFGSPVAASFNMFGVPSTLQAGGDMHLISIIAASGLTSSRLLNETFVDVAARAGTPFVLPAPLPVPVVTDAGGPYKRPNAVVTGIPAELNSTHSMLFSDNTDPTKVGFVSATQGWVGGSNVTLTLPNFSGVGTFQNSWAPATGDALSWTVSSAGGTFVTQCAAGQRFVTSSRSGTL